MTKSIFLNTGAYFEWHVKLIAAVFIVVGVAWIPGNVIGGILLMMFSIVPFGINYYFLINPEKKYYRDGVSLFGIRFGLIKRYQTVEYLFLKQKKVTRTYNSRVQSASITDFEFDGYIRFSEKEKIHLRSDADREVVMKDLTSLSNALKVQIFDYTHDGRAVSGY